MKTSSDPRHRIRIKVMQELFAWDFGTANGRTNQPTSKQISQTASLIVENIAKIDSFITDAAPTWPIAKINKIDLAILRLAVYELLINLENPPKVIVDEAVELAKEYGAESSPSFINGALGKLISDHNISA
jgi:transcription antitermination protein NusB